MKIHSAAILWILTFIVLGGAALRAQEQKLVVDPAKSEVHFTLVDTLHTVHGTFHIQQGEVMFQPATGQTTGKIVVDALSGASGNSTRDKKMNREYLQVENFKTVTFSPMKFMGTFNASGDSALQVHGMFTILGTAHEIDVPMQVQVNGSQFHATGAFDVPYVKWGMKDPSNFAIKVHKEVQIELLLVGSLQR